jgi:NAD(P)H-hydrate epimerase
VTRNGAARGMQPDHAIAHEQALYRAQSVRALERAAIDDLAIPGIDLMERAGAAAFAALAARWPAPARIAVLCGPGNNGGDGFVVARLAAAAGRAVDCFVLGDPQRLRAEAATAAQRLCDAGVRLQALSDFAASAYEVVVDALFGIGLARALDGEAAALVRALNESPGGRVALDIPSGLHADTGNATGSALRADLTVTFIALKRGLYTGDARDLCGEIVLATLDLPAAAYAAVPADARRLSLARLGRPLGPRARRAHKGHFGHVLVIGGDHGFAGAAHLCAEAAARSGAGLTSVATRAAHAAALVAARPELMVRAVEGAGDLDALLDAASVIAIGPGLGRGAWGRALLARVLASTTPRVLDADALNLLAADEALGALLASAPTVLTPHPGEAARLLGCSTAQVEADRFAAAQALCAALGCTVLLKGAGSVVHSQGALAVVIEGGNPGMASGGMGDVLTGVVAALLAQGLNPHQAAAVAGTVHAAAADAAAADGERGLLASDLYPHLRRLLSAL